MDKLVILIAGKKQSGKNLFANQVILRVLQERNVWDESDAGVNSKGRLCVGGIPIGGPVLKARLKEANIYLTSFAEPIKNFCVDVLGLRWEQCWGTDADKNTLTELRWDTLPDIVKIANARYVPFAASSRAQWPSGFMTAREVMQVFGTDLMRRWVSDIWINACVHRVVANKYRLTLVPDVRFPNELKGWDALRNHGIELRTVRLLRAPAAEKDKHSSEQELDAIPLEDFDFVVPNCEGVAVQGQLIHATVETWLSAAGLI